MINYYTLVLDMDLTMVSTFSFKNNIFKIISDLNYNEKNELLDTNPELYPLINPDANVIYNKIFLTKFIINDVLYIVFYRPYLFNFLKVFSKLCKIIIYSLGRKTYIYKLVDFFINVLNFNPFYQVICNSDDDSDYSLDKNIKKINLDIDFSKFLVIDDNPTVWNDYTKYVFAIKPFSISSHDIEFLKIIQTKNLFLVNL